MIFLTMTMCKDYLDSIKNNRLINIIIKHDFLDDKSWEPGHLRKYLNFIFLNTVIESRVPDGILLNLKSQFG
jgi:hypothetical protein